MIRFAVICLLLTGRLAAQPDVEWSGEAPYRILFQTEHTAGPAARSGNERPAEVLLDFDALLKSAAPGRTPDLTTLQVIRYDPGTGKPVRQGQFAYARGRYDIPWRWYDASIGYDFPEFQNNINETNGQITYTPIPRFGYFYDCIGEWKQGHLAFLHRELTGEGCYSAYFDLLPIGARPETVEPRGWLGDGLNRCEPAGGSTTGLIHSRVDAVDWDEDGRCDLVLGCGRGGVVWYPNRGQTGEPRFPFSKLLRTADGMPIDVGWSATPKCVDWDGDGVRDLLVGGEWNRVLYYHNEGTHLEPKLVCKNLLRTDDGQPLHVPWEPSPETEKYYKYTRDYYPVLEVCDWDNDGDIDLLAGGYVTGRIYLFDNTAGAGHEPVLHFAGPLEADGEPLDVAWAAAPTVGDLDGDGDLDLITGSMPMTAGGGDASSSEKFLYCFRNDGARSKPQLHGIPFPKRGDFPSSALATPRLIDWSGDGLPDLVVSSGNQVYLYRNVGSVHEPLFEVHGRALPSVWGSASLPGNQFIDWDGDGLLDAVAAPLVYRNLGRGSPGVFDSGKSVLAGQSAISHLSGIGDDWTWPRLFDLDGDGRVDYLDADHPGHFWWHRNTGGSARPMFDPKGVQLALINGQLMSVGVPAAEGFDALQGARATYAVADFDGDRRPDLVSVNTEGSVLYFQQSERKGQSDMPLFEAGVTIGKIGSRGAPYAADWNTDGRMDVVVSADPDRTFVFLGQPRGSARPFSEAQHIQLARAPYGAGGPIVVTDFNGDGDPDILLFTAYGYCCFYEHSFITSGYAEAKVGSLEKKPSTASAGR